MLGLIDRAKSLVENTRNRVEVATFHVLKHVPGFRAIYVDIMRLAYGVQSTTAAIQNNHAMMLQLFKEIAQAKQLMQLVLSKLNDATTDTTLPPLYSSEKTTDKPN